MKRYSEALSKVHGKVCLIDGDVLVYRVGFASQDVPLGWALRRMRNKVEEIGFLEAKCESLIVAVSDSAQHYRHHIAKTKVYKGNRIGKDKPKHYAELRAYLIDVMGAVVSSGCEADDVLGHLSQALAGRCVVASIDKDLLMLPGEHYNITRHESSVVTEASARVHFYRQIVTGDTVDNIQGMGRGATEVANEMCEPMDEDDLFAWAVEGFSRSLRKTLTEEKTDDEIEALAVERVLENGHLLWIQRTPDTLWVPPAAGRPAGRP